MDQHEELLSFIKEFASVNKTFENVLKIFEKRKLKAEEKCDSLLNYIALELMVRPTCFDEIIKYFSREMPLLLYKIILTKGNSKCYHIAYSVIFGKVVMKRPDLQGYALRYFKTHPSPFEEIFEMEVSKKRKVQSIMVVDDLDIVESCYYLLRSNPDFYRNKWNWSVFMKNYLDHSNVRVKWLCCYTMSVLFGMSEYQLRKLTSSKVSQTVDREFACVFHLNSTLITSNVVNEDQFPENVTSLKKDDHCVNISGIYIPIEAKAETLSLVEVPSTVENLRKLAEGLSSNKGICLQGVVGSGKTSLVEYLASKTGRKLGEEFLKIQLGDQTDSKMLLGTYRCTDIPGEFVWQPGVLTQAVLRGSWLLLEDIDSASMDIASVLTSLLENRYLTVPGYRDTVPVTPGFQLFVTQRLISTISGHHKKHSNAITLMEKQLLRINIDPLSTNELKTILETRFVEFKTITDRMINVFLLFTLSVKDGTISVPKSGRLISTRDFFKWCTRAVVDFDVKSQDSALKVLQDAIDVFCCSFSNSEESLSLAKQISTHLGIINQKAEYFFKSYKPTMTLTADNLVAGRVALKRQNNEYSKKTKYSFTRLSSVLIERIMCCISLREPVLLVGETGTGKTSCIQFLANTLGKKLVVINMNQQSDSVDLLGGFKPVDLKYVIGPVRRDFERIFCDFFQVEPNKKYLGHIALCFNNQRWLDLVKLMSMSYQAAVNRLTKSINDFETLKSLNKDKYKKDKEFLTQWNRIGEKLHKLELQLKQKTSLAFAFIEGSLVKAVENGYWVLLDEINLANAETLECLSGLLEGSRGSLCLLERGDMQPIKRHSDFTLFACMNPSTDVGKKDLPSGLRNRFTEFFVDELNEKSDLLLLVNSYLEAMCLKPNELENIVNFYLNIRKEMMTSLSDGLGHKPHFSLRSLCRALVIASKNPCGTFKRSLYEAFCLSFLTQLDSISYKTVEKMIVSYMLGDQKATKAIMNKQIPEPQSKTEKYLQFEGYWVKTGVLEPHSPPDYILTESVRRNLKDLVRVVSIGKLPVLLQGDTSVGKTSLITYLAKSSGNKCVRINNHEHTDLQEYIGSYVADMDGKLVFREGLLVEAMRKGHWIILDELNLAPTDVLEALNRVLDDNRELYIPETQETVKADSNFMLFATQNPPGVYGGRKMLSRAFRNRFVELHFNEIPPKELEAILHQRCQMAPSYAKKMINVMMDLQMRRRGSAAFAGKQGFMTLRDLFRWGERYRLADNVDRLYDWDQHLADEGYLVLAGKVRKIEEKHEIAGVLQKHLKREVVPENLFTLSEYTSTVTRTILEKIRNNEPKHSTIVWTYNMRQLAVLTTKAMHFNEPVLLVGETGGGKTTMCKLIAESNGQQLITVNCHMHTESSDFIGGLRPVRDHNSEDTVKLFEWIDGPLIQAMQQGHVFLADEISLADDSVLERLNSLLEPERTLLLAEKGIDLNNCDNSELIVANPKFHFIGTMNPGGDFGKKELSPALRNRFTEIWCVPCESREDLIAIVEKNIKPGLHMGKPQAVSSGIGDNIIDFVQWFQKTNIGRKFTVSIRDILTWVNFMNKCSDNINVTEAYIQGAFLTFIDSLGSGITSTESRHAVLDFCMKCNDFFLKQLETRPLIQRTSTDIRVKTMNNKFGIEPFFIESRNCQDLESSFIFNAPTTASNTLMLLRGMQLNKPILLEGSPGVGKTSLVSAVAKATGHELFRVNLSDQTDISDLFGADLPVEGGIGGQFSWRDGPLLQALKRGSWILLDELNLASQSVLEGLNACLDHRGEIYIPELGKTFYVKTGTKFFGCQNPLKQGGSRRGLPRSFLNRFTQVYINSLRDKDLHHILTNSFRNIPSDIISDMIKFNNAVAVAVENHIFGQKGSPWECNLRDLTRWCEAMIYHRDSNSISDSNPSMINDGYNPDSVVDLIYGDRMRTSVDKKCIREQFESAFGREIRVNHPVLYVNSESVHIGDVRINRRHKGVNMHVLKQDSECLVLRSQLDALRSLAYCVNLNWMAILVGDSGSGKSSVVKTLANLAGKTLKTLPVTSAMDTADLLGGFEQTDYTRHLDEIAKETEITAFDVIQDLLSQGKDNEAIQVLAYWEAYRTANESTKSNMDEELKLFQRRCGKLKTTLQILKSLSNHSGIPEDLETKLNIVTASVAREKSLNAGGKFEWVDSLLIKCLRDGSWLLIDNVNLCSSAVLDRLNALLEPNGTLTIFERGINENGTVVEIQPHEDFRLFLTMDPKNGEISRAMRNRGIEIYMLNETESDKINEFDLMSLVYSEGIENPSIIKGVIKFHQFVCEILPGEKPSINDMLQTASLLSKQLTHSCQSVSEKFLDAVMEVYYKTRSPFDFNCVDAISTIKNKVNELLSNLSDPNGNDLFENRLTLSTKKMEICSIFEKIRQQAVYLEHHMHIDIESVRVSNISINYLVAFYSIFSPEDLEFRHLYLNNQLSNKSLEESCYAIASKYKNECQNLPYDPNWISGAIYKVRPHNYHNLNLALYIRCFYSNENTTQSDKSKKVMTLLKYMHKIKENKLEDMFNDMVISNFLDIIKYFDEYTCEIIASNINLSAADVISFINFFLWRLIFLECTSVSVKQTTAVQRYAISTNLRVHYKWFYKHSVGGIRKIANTKLSLSLETLLESVNNSLNTEFSAMNKVGKRYQKVSNRPPPFINEHQLSTVPLFNCINALYNIVDRSSDPIKILNIFIQERQLRPLLIQMKSKMSYEFDDLSKEITLLESLHEKCQTLQYLEQVSKFTVQIMPVIDIFNHLDVKRCMIAGQNSGIVDNILIPTDLVGTLELYNKSRDVRLRHEIFKASYLYFMNSASIRPSKFMGSENEVVVLNTFSPRLTYFITNLLLKSETSQNLSQINLGNFREVIKQHDNLSKIIWGNMNQLSQESYDYILQEKEHVMSIFKSMALQLSQLDDTHFGTLLSKLYEELDNVDTDISSTDCSLGKDCVAFYERFKGCIIDYRQLLTVKDIDKTLLLISNLYMNVSTMKAIFNSQLSLIDPLAKKSLKKEYCLEAIKLFEDMKACYELQNRIYSNYDTTVHEYHACLENMIWKLKKTNEKLEKYVAVRECEVLYESVIRVINHAFSTVLSEDYITKTNSSLNDCIKYIIEAAVEMRDVNDKDCLDVLNKEESKIISYENLIHSWNRLRNSYPDIVEPLLCNVSEFVYGMKMKTSLLRKLLISYKMRKYGIDVNRHLICLVRWPILNAEQNSYGQHILELVNMSGITFFESEAMKHEKFRLLKCAIQESFNHNVVNSIGTETLDRKLFLEFSNLLNVVVNVWNKQEERKKILQDEVDSLYKTKSKCDDKPEEEQLAEELTKLFPNYHSIDFADFEQSPDLPEEQYNIESKSNEIFTYEDIKSIMNLHSVLLKNYTRTEWLNPDRKRNVHCDFIRPFVEKYKVFRRVFDEFVDSFDYTMDNKLIGSLSVLIAVNKNQEDVSQICDIVNKKNTDFYKDPNTEEVKLCYHILEELRLKIKEFLREWPEQPTLKTIITAIDRINNFDINSPISRFLTGFEIVLNKCHEWEQVAHSGVSLSQFYQSLTEQIISWRKLELSMWKDLLNRTYDRLNESMAKWWLYLYSIMHDFIVEKSHDETKLIELLQSFITTSNLAEFQGRLELLYIFHCHATYFERSKESEMFINILWNVYNYFEQFSLTVANKVKDLRSPIEKKLKDYVKIVRWKDISYWAVKETVDKSHKILHKYMREFQDALQQPVSSCLHNIKNNSDSEMEGIWDRPQRQNPKSYHYTLYAESYMAKLSVAKKFQLINLEEGEGVFSKMESYFLKSRKLCKNTILATSYPNLIQCLEGLITDIISTSTHLQNLEVDTTLSKEKQKSRAKQILQQKHLALSVLFKNLSLIGLSFRTGIIKNKLKKSSEDFLLKPIDLTANFHHINNERSEEKILTMWNSCEFYYTRSLMRADVLETALQTPAKDLGMQNIERCKGFSAHLLDLAQKQKTDLIESSRIYYYLRYYIKQINDAHDGKFFLSFKTVNEILTLFQKTMVVLNQYKIILNTCPPEDGFSDQNIEIPILREGVKEVFYRNTKIWTNTTTMINEILTTVTKLSCILVKCKGSVPSIEYELFSPEFIPINDKAGLINEIFNLSCNIRKLREMFSDIVLSDSLVWLEDEYHRIEYLCNVQVTDDNSNGSKNDVEKFMEQTLLVIQNLYKKYTSADKEQHKENEDESQLQQESPLQQDHLKTLLVENLSCDIALLEMKKILIRTDKVAQIMLTTPQDTTVKKMACQCVPLLEQIVHLYQYFITQQVATYRIIVKMSSVLLNIFIELTSKGFCTPPEFSDDMDGEGISKPTDGLGLGEGQGERDVSDKIESEDQLEDAQPAGQDKEKDEDADCKEEDKGIEMSEDFDSKLQDKDKKEGDDSDESSGDEDADEQMGDTEKGAEQLDQEIWGSDKEDEQEEGDGEEDTKNEERGDKGEKEGEEQLGAKDQNRSKDNDEEQDNETSEEREKTKKEINEMEEPEYDDEQMDLHHGKQPELPEPEPMDLPEDLQLDEGQEHDNDDNPEENPFDIDTMKEQNEPDDTEQGEDVTEEDKKNDEERDFSSDDEEIAEGDQKDQEDTAQEHIDDNDKEEDRGGKSTEIEKEEDKTKDTSEESTLDQTQSNQDNVEAMEVDKAEATDKVETSQDIQKSTQPIDELCQEDRPDSEGVGQSQMEESSTGHSAQTSASQDIKSSKTDVEEEMFKQKPGESDSKRSLGDVDEPVRKKLKTIDLKQSVSETQLEEDERAEEEQSEMYQHIHEGEKSKTQVLDVATDEQVQTQKKTIPNEEDEEIEDSSEPSKDVPEDDECKDIEIENVTVEKPNKTEGSKEGNSKKKQHPEGDVLEEIQDIDVEGEVIETLTVPRTTDSSHHTLYTDISKISATRLTSEETNNLRLEVEKQLSSWNEPPATHEADQTWQKISSVTSALAQDLSEQLRLVLEPTQASRLKGDYRTGRRINMRKVIPYIASQFRKDKIWLRRSKPSKREYHIVIAIDDSSSMVDNHSKELAFESVALISKALTLLESGQLSVMSFGETTEIVHKLTDQFTDKSGAKLLQKFRFNQNKTCVAKLVDFVTEMFQQTHLQSNALNAKLLVVVSDGRGVFSEGETYVKQAVRRAKLANIFMVFVIIDNPDNKNSVLDIRMPVFKDGKLLGIQNYMDEFPFSFYIILRDINSLPSVLSDALRQWFEIVSNLE